MAFFEYPLPGWLFRMILKKEMKRILKEERLGEMEGIEEIK